MNIVLIGPYYPFRGGISDTNQELCQNLIKSGHNVDMPFGVKDAGFKMVEKHNVKYVLLKIKWWKT